MKALLAKDLRQLGPWALLILPAHAVLAANGIFSPEFYFWWSAGLALGFTVLLLTLEWRLDAERFVASLPVSRAEVVKARYAATLAVAVVATALFGLYGEALTSMGRHRLPRIWAGRLPGWESWEGYLALFLVLSLVSLTFLPFHFRLGFGRGSVAFLATALPTALLSVLAARGLGEGASSAAAHAPLPSEAIRTALAAQAGQWGAGSTAAASLIAVALLGFLSVRLSIRFYDRRDL